MEYRWIQKELKEAEEYDKHRMYGILYGNCTLQQKKIQIKIKIHFDLLD